MSELSQQINEDMKAAMREKNTLALNVIRMLKASIKNAAIEKGGAGAELTDPEIVVVVRKEVKKRQDAVEQFTSGGRSEQAAQESAEIEILQSYLPAALSESELTGIIDTAITEIGATSRKDMGSVMKLVQERAGGRADGKLLSQAVMAKLQ